MSRPIPWPTERITEKPSPSTRFWTACETSPRGFPPGLPDGVEERRRVEASSLRAISVTVPIDASRGVGHPAVEHADVELERMSPRSRR